MPPRHVSLGYPSAETEASFGPHTRGEEWNVVVVCVKYTGHRSAAEAYGTSDVGCVYVFESRHVTLFGYLDWHAVRGDRPAPKLVGIPATNAPDGPEGLE